MSAAVVNRLKGTGYNQISMPTLSPEQQNLFSMMMGKARPGISGGLDRLSQMAGGGTEQMWRGIEAPAMRQFAGLQGNIASRFSQAGGRRSSGFQNRMGQAGADLSERLQSNRMQLQNQAIQELLGMGKNLLSTNLSESFLAPKPKSFWQELGGSFAGGAGMAFGKGLGGGWF